MAARKNTAPAAPKMDTEALVTMFVTLESFDSTAENMTDTKTLADEMKINADRAVELLTLLEDAGAVGGEGRGASAEWFIALPDVNENNAEDVIREALADFTPDAPQTASKATVETPKPSAASVFTPAPDGLPKGTEITLSDGTPATVIADEIVKITVPAAFKEETHESDIVKRGEALEIPEFIPALPQGVNHNTWYMAHASITQKARDWWSKRADAQREAYAKRVRDNQILANLS